VWKDEVKVRPRGEKMGEERKGKNEFPPGRTQRSLSVNLLKPSQLPPSPTFESLAREIYIDEIRAIGRGPPGPRGGANAHR
jgi:hypothetical protein